MSDKPSNICKVLVTGGTGFVGRNILKELKRQGYSIRCLVRPASQKLDVLKPFQPEIVQGDIWKKETLTPAFEAIDAVIHLIGIIQPHKENTFERVHIEGTANMIEQSKQRGVKKFVHMSALGTRADGKSRYHQTKWAAEELVRNSGLRYTIFRPSIIFGENCEFLNVMQNLIHKPLITPIVGLGQNKMQPIYVGDVARFFVEALGNPECDNKSFGLGGTKEYTFDALIDTLTATMGKKKLKMHLPIYLMKVPAFLMELTLSKPPFTRDQLAMLKEDNACEMSETLRIFKFELTDFEKCAKESFTLQVT